MYKTYIKDRQFFLKKTTLLETKKLFKFVGPKIKLLRD